MTERDITISVNAKYLVERFARLAMGVGVMNTLKEATDAQWSLLTYVAGLEATADKVGRFWRKPLGSIIPGQCESKYGFSSHIYKCDRPKHDDGEHWCCIEESARVVWRCWRGRDVES